MSEIVNSVGARAFVDEPIGAVELRIFRSMFGVVGIAIIASVALAPARFTGGLALGGALALLNYHWLRSSVRALLIEATVKRPRFTIMRYVFRYLIVGTIIYAAFTMQLISVPATIIGLCAFVPALFIEALRQFYFIIIRGEGTN